MSDTDAESNSSQNSQSSINSLNSLELAAPLIRAIEEMGFEEFTEIQQDAIPPALEGKDILASAKTGSGKTAAFLLPILNQLHNQKAPNSGTRALILIPTRELAIQIEKAFEKFARYTYIKCGLVIGGEAFKHQIAKLRRNPEVLIATPGRLVEHLDRGTIDLRDLECLVLDEADQMLKMGFSEDLERIASMAKDERQNFLFSATLKQKGMHRIQQWLQDPYEINLDRSLELNAAITQQIIFADDPKHKEKLTLALIDDIHQEDSKKKIFIFCNTRAQCQQLGNFLKYKKNKVGIIHSEIPQSERKQVMHNFRQGHINILVATDVAARGLDIDQVELVINYTVAQTGDDHTHRIGRTGRAGKNGVAVSLVSGTEYNTMSSIERYLKIKSERRVIKGLEGSYTGPKKTKSNGKATGSKTKDKTKSKAKGKTSNKPSNKKTAAKKSPAKKKAAAKGKMVTSGDGHGALRRRK